MLKAFVNHVKKATGKKFPWQRRRIKWVVISNQSIGHTTTKFLCSCLAHVINLATQALISTYSKSLFFDPKDPEAHMPTTRDEVGLVRAIAVKARIYKIAILQQTQNHILQQRSSSKRKEMFKTIQAEAGVSRSKQLILDMKVRWSSTYLMIHRAESNKKVRPLACLLLAMTHVICSMLIHLFTQWHLKKPTWRNMIRFYHWSLSHLSGSMLDCSWGFLLYVYSVQFRSSWCSHTLEQHADNAQQAFSSDQISTLHLGIPALKALHKAWSSRIKRAKYAPFVSALEAACAKVDEYYEKTTLTDAYVLVMSKWSFHYMIHIKFTSSS